ncbi:19348_t:CDS:1 [Gigaspora rosea]|nr:19348_t:CDS:1 [Gigaspora rosea]
MDNSNNISTSSNTPTTNQTTSIDISKIDLNTKVYIDEACRASTNEIINSIKAYINQSTSNHMNLIKKLNERLDACVNQQQNLGTQFNTTPSNKHIDTSQAHYSITNQNFHSPMKQSDQDTRL